MGISVDEEEKISNKRIGKRFVPPQKAFMSSVAVVCVCFFYLLSLLLFLFNISLYRNTHWLFLHRRFTSVFKLTVTVRFFLFCSDCCRACVSVYMWTHICTCVSRWARVCVCVCVLLFGYLPRIYSLFTTIIFLLQSNSVPCVFMLVHFGSVSYNFFSSLLSSTFYFKFILRVCWFFF